MTLKAYYSFEQTSGDLFDLSGNGNDSTSVTVTSRTANGILGGNSYEFDGSDDYVGIPDSSSMDTGSVSVCVWIYPRVIQTTSMV
jgi:hypothetical protein